MKNKLLIRGGIAFGCLLALAAVVWPNRMIGDAASLDQRFTQTTYCPFKAGDPLLPSGLLGPVRVLRGDPLANN